MKAIPVRAVSVAVLAVASVSSAPLHAQTTPIDAAPLPLADKRLPASSEECAVWQRELAFARSVEAHDGRPFAAFLHPGAVFAAGTPDSDRGRDEIVKSWAGIVDGRTIALRWRPGIVVIGGEPTIAVSRGAFILQRMDKGAAVFRVGMFQTVWVKSAKDREPKDDAAKDGDAKDGTWRVLFDGSATTSEPMKDRAAAERWVQDQPMSDCAA